MCSQQDDFALCVMLDAHRLISFAAELRLNAQCLINETWRSTAARTAVDAEAGEPCRPALGNPHGGVP